MKKILFLTSKYLPTPGANGLIVNIVVTEMKKRGYKCSVVSICEKGQLEYEVFQNIEIYRVSPSFYTKYFMNTTNEVTSNIFRNILHIFRKIYQLIFIFNFPNFDNLQNIKVSRLINKLHEKNSYDMIIGVYKPFANIQSLMQFKKKKPGVLVGGYFLDLLSSMKKPKFMLSSFYYYLIHKSEKKILKSLNFILLPITEQSKVSSKYDDTKKIGFVDFPTFIEVDYSIPIAKDSNTIVFGYAGTLDANYRNPDIVFKALSYISTDKKIEIHLFSKNRIDNKTKNDYQSDKFLIFEHGYMNHNDIISFFKYCDFLINITNSSFSAIPSKIFELFSFGKPIVNFLSNPNDPTLQYFAKYPSYCNFSKNVAFDNQLLLLNKFIISELGMKYDLATLKNTFYMNTPEFTVDEIEKHILRGEKNEQKDTQ